MKRLTICIAVAVMAAAPSTIAQAKAPLCQHKAGDTLYRSAKVRVFQRVTASKKDSDADTARIFACRISSRKVGTIEIFRNSLDARVSIRGVLVGGDRWLVLDAYAATGVAESREIYEYDLSTGKRRFHHGIEDPLETPLVLTRDGGIALGGPNGSVIAFDAAGLRTLEAGGATDLAAAGNTVYWTAGGTADGVGGQPRSGVLTGAATGGNA